MSWGGWKPSSLPSYSTDDERKRHGECKTKYSVLDDLQTVYLLYSGQENSAPTQRTSKKKKKKKSSQETTPPLPQATDSVGRRKKRKQKDVISLGVNGFLSEDGDGEDCAQPPNNSTDDVDASARPDRADQSSSSEGEDGDKTSSAERVLNGDSGVGKPVSCDEEDKDEEERLQGKQKLKGKKAKDARKRAKEASSAAEPEAKVSSSSVGSLSTCVGCISCGHFFMLEEVRKSQNIIFKEVSHVAF